MAKPIKSTSTEWRDVVLICRKCSKKLDGGFGPDGDLTLKKALRKYLHLKTGKKGRKGELTVAGVDCFDICPKGAVVAVNTAQPKKLLIVPAGDRVALVIPGVVRLTGTRQEVIALVAALRAAGFGEGR